MIELRHVSNYALNNVSLQIAKGEIFAVIGASGAGKSTLLRCINFLERPASGTVHVSGQDVANLSATDLRLLRQRIGMVFQHFNLLGQATVFDNIALPLRLAAISEATIKTRVTELLTLVNLPDKADSYPKQLSGGQRQRVAIARALATEPDILLCDEATSALDPKATQAILQLLQTINKRLGITIVIITHEMQVVKAIADRVAVLDVGCVIEQNRTVALFADPQHPITKHLVQDSLQGALSDTLQQQLQITCLPQHSALLRLTFIGQSSAQPLIAELIKTQHVVVSLLQANIDYVQQQSFGTMILQVLSDGAADLVKTQTFLQHHNVNVEVLGYVPNPMAGA